MYRISPEQIDLMRRVFESSTSEEILTNYINDPYTIGYWKIEAAKVLHERKFLTTDAFKNILLEISKTVPDVTVKLKELHGEEFVKELHEEFELDEDAEEAEEREDDEEREEGEMIDGCEFCLLPWNSCRCEMGDESEETEAVHYSSVRSRMIEILSNRSVFWIAGFFDGIITIVFLKYMGIV